MVFLHTIKLFSLTSMFLATELNWNLSVPKSNSIFRFSGHIHLHRLKLWTSSLM